MYGELLGRRLGREVAVKTVGRTVRITVSGFPVYGGKTQDVEVLAPARVLGIGEGVSVPVGEILFRAGGRGFPSPLVKDSGQLVRAVRIDGSGGSERVGTPGSFAGLVSDVLGWGSVDDYIDRLRDFEPTRFREEFVREALRREVERHRASVDPGRQAPEVCEPAPMAETNGSVARVEVSRAAAERIHGLVSGDPEHECGGVLIGSLCTDPHTGKVVSCVDDVFTDGRYGTESGYEFTADCLLECMAYMRGRYGSSKRFIGTVHSHAGFPPFFSGTDREMMGMRRGAEVHLVVSPSHGTYTACYKDPEGDLRDAACLFPEGSFPYRRV